MSPLTGEINFKSKKKKNTNPPEFIYAHSSKKKKTRLPKSRRVNVEGKRETNSENRTALLQGNLSGVNLLQSVEKPSW